MEWLGQIGGIAGIAALIGVILSYLSSSRKEFKVIINGLQIQFTNSQHEYGRLFNKIDKLESTVEKLENFYESE